MARPGGRGGDDDGGATVGTAVGTGLVVGGMFGAAIGGFIIESGVVFFFGAVFLGAGIIVLAGSGGALGDSGGGVGLGAGGDGAPGDTGGGSSSGGSGGCFASGTPILMADGTLRPIEAVQTGDLVLSRDEHTGATQAQRVSRLWVHHVPTTLRMHLADGEVVETTKEHRFFVPDQGFVGAGQLREGAHLGSHGGASYAAAAFEPLEQRATVFNLQVENFHTFFVGHAQLWVHNEKITDPGD